MLLLMLGLCMLQDLPQAMYQHTVQNRQVKQFERVCVQCIYLGNIVKVVHPVDLALILCCEDHLTLDVFIIRNGEALTHGPGGHELGPVGVVDGILQSDM